MPSVYTILTCRDPGIQKERQGIVVTAGGPTLPAALQDQLALGRRLVIHVGAHQRRQQLLRVTREGETTFRQEALGVVRFVPLIGAQGWPARKPSRRGQRASSPQRSPERALREESCDATHVATAGCV